MKSLFFLTFLTCFLQNYLLSQQSTQILTFFVKRYNAQNNLEEKVKNKISNPGSITNAAMKRALFPSYTNGLIASYLGQVSLSDMYGQIIFSYLAKKNIFNMIITQSIKPVFIRGRTIHHFVISETKDASWFVFEKVPVDNNKFYWKVSQKEIPQNKVIPVDAIIVFSLPENIMVQTGNFPSKYENNIVLPDIYTTKTINVPLAAIKFLKIRKYFAPIKKHFKFDVDRYQLMIS